MVPTFLLSFGEIFRIFQPKKPGFLEKTIAFLLLPPNLIHRLVDHFHDVEFIEYYGCIGE